MQTRNPQRARMSRRTRTAHRRRMAIAAIVFAAILGMLLAGCSRGTLGAAVTVTATAGGAGASGSDAATPTSASEPLASKIRVSATPKFGSADVAPAGGVSVTVFSGTIEDLTVTGDDGLEVAGSISEDKATWKLTDRLAYNTTYTFEGTAVAADGSRAPITGSLHTVKPESTIRASIQIPPGTTVGVAAPVIITFAEPIVDKAAAERTFKLTTDKGEIRGSWGWLPDEDIQGSGVKQSIVHYRPAEYWPAYTNVHVEANLLGVDYGNGSWGREDIATDFTVGRKQVVLADVTTFHMVVFVDDKVVKNYPVSYGKESVPGRATVSGVHVVTEKYPEFSMCNPEFDYCNVLEKFAVRINNNGEFIHENPLTVPYLGKENVSHGCVNMGPGDAEEYYNSTIYGDPVEVTNTGAPMTEKDYIYDWIYPFAEWQQRSALA